MRKFLIAFALSLLIIPALGACRAPKKISVVKGKDGSFSKVAWVLYHSRSAYPTWEGKRTKVKVAVDGRGNVYLLDKQAAGSRLRGFRLTKIKPDGKIAWTIKQLPAKPAKILPQDIGIDSHNNIVMVAAARFKKSGPGIYIQKFSPAGKRLWRVLRRLQPLPGTPGFMIRLNDDNIYIYGGVVEKNKQKPWLARYNDGGKLMWERFPTVKDFRWEQPNTLEIKNKVIVITSHGLVNNPYAWDKVSSFETRRGYDFDGRSAVPPNGGGNLTPEMLPPPILAHLRVVGPRGYIYSISPDIDKLDIWLNLFRRDAEESGPFLRVAVKHAPQKPGSFSLNPAALAVDRQGNAYLVIIETKEGRAPRTLLYKLRIKLPKKP